MNKDFPLDRFDFSDLIEYIRGEKELPKIITDMETGIESYNTDNISRDKLSEFLENFNILDNLAQANAQQEYQEHEQLGVENFQLEPSWVKIKHSTPHNTPQPSSPPGLHPPHPDPSLPDRAADS